jgi:hypothetical protein
MNLETNARIVAALNDNDGLLKVKTADEAGVSKSSLLRAVEAGAVKRTARNRYVLPGTESRQLAYQGAYLGQDAVLSFRGAWSYWMLDGIDGLHLEWSVRHGSRVNQEHVIQRRRYDELDVAVRDGVVVTSVRQTLLDIAARFDLDLVERAYESALRLGLVDDVETREWVADHAGWQGAPGLRAVQARRRPGERPTGSDDETIVMQIYRRYGIDFERQFEVVDEDGILIGYADFGHPPSACLTEVDGLGTHDLANRQHDYNRQGRMEDIGYLVRRHTHEDVRYREKYVVQRTRRGIALALPLEPMSSKSGLWLPKTGLRP